MSAIIQFWPLPEMQAEVDRYCHAMGWREDPPVFADCMALLHEEVSEAGSAWRHWDMTDMTGKVTGNQLALDASKPEGVGSEFADLLIRLLDDSELFGVNLAAEASRHAGRYSISGSFLTNMDILHVMIAKASMAHDADDWPDEEGDRGGWTWRRQFGTILMFLAQLCEFYGVDLQAEYTRKMAYNRTRPYRHGGKQR
jgi:NTP pyrophosphatase (non-canonical NTP hydrolase)